MKWLLAVVAIAIGSPVYGAEPAPATQPTTQPAIRVVVMPFVPLGDAGKVAWVSQAIQQNLIAELSRSRAFQASAGNVPDAAALDPAVVRQASEKSGANLAVMGNVQVIEQDLRITGQVMDVSTGQIIGGLKATGSVRDLFEMEDQLAGQLRRILPAITSAPVAANPAAPVAQGVPPQPAPPALAIVPSGPLRSEYPWDKRNEDPAMQRGADQYRYNIPDYSSYGWGYYPTPYYGWRGNLYGYNRGFGYGGYSYPYLVPIYPIVNVRISPGVVNGIQTPLVPNGTQQPHTTIPNPVPPPGTGSH